MEKKISCCGTICSECEYYPDSCRGCQEIKGRVFWLEYTQESICDIYECCMNQKKHDHCGQCSQDLQTIPGVGRRISQHLKAIGIHCVDDLKGRDPEELYQLDCIQKGFKEDRCQLYVFRCAVYYAEHEVHDPEKLKWWYWKDKV